MALKITLKPHERLIIGGAVITNGSTGTDLVVENNVPILRQKDIMSLNDANSPCRRIYFTIQLMYVNEKDLAEHHRIFWELVKDVTGAAPSQKGRLAEVSALVLNRRYYQALKVTKKLIAYEQEAMNHARKADRGL